MSRFPWLVLLLCFSVAVPRPAYAAISAKPNVLLVLVDDQGYGDLSVHGNPVLKTPQMDRLHSESLRFTDFHVAPMCTPTRGQLMTGVDALRNGAMNVSSGRTNLRRDFPTMPEIFAAGGYRTGMFGKWHLGDNYPYRPQDRGFQESIWYQSSSIPSAAGYFNNDYFDDVYQHNGSPKKYEGYTTDVFFREAQTWMKQQAERHEPFFCYLPLAAAHGPFFVPDRYREPYRQQPHRVASFFGMIANIDENLGRLDAFLRENGLHENTILIFMTDNGTATGDPVFNAGMRDKKIGLYDGGHRVPFFIRWPAGKLRAAGDVADLTQVQDVLPTLLELCDVAKPAAARFDGTSLAGLLHDPAATLPDRKLTIQFSRMNDSRPKPGDAVVLWKRWRLVADQELYDLATDPAQERNVITQFPDVAAALRDHYATWWAGVEPRLLEISPIHLGSASANPVQLSPCDWVDVFFDQQNQVRGTKKNGAWSLFVEHAGEYEISLRRWPIEADAPITAAMPAFKGVDGGFAAGDAFPVASADLKIGAELRQQAVTAEDKSVNFRLTLPRGPVALQTWFRDSAGLEIAGAYYVYVRALRPEK
ncbi:MAG: arylsulfatase [Opitutaceae bacterium]|nr:arylsulfatase [Opitutaceae bacterium]